MKDPIRRIPMWVLFLLGSVVAAAASVTFSYTGMSVIPGLDLHPLAGIIPSLFMTILLAMCAGLDLMETRAKRRLQEPKDEKNTFG